MVSGITGNAGDKVEDADDSDDSDDDDDEEGDDLMDMADMPPKPVAKKGRRVSVSAESLDPTQAKKKYLEQRKVHPKGADEEARIKMILRKNVLFKGLDDDQMHILTEAFESKEIPEGEVVITQGMEGDYFYIIDQGTCDVFVKKPGESKDAEGRGDLVMSCKAEDYFGDLALMYNAPRAATVVATSDCKTYQLDRMSFKVMLTTTTTQKREKYTLFLKECRILATMEQNELMQLADSLEEEVFKEGEVIFKQGDTGEKFYLVKTGAVKISQQLGAAADPVEISTLTEGNYFGEIALINDRPRQATATASEAGTVCLQVSQKVRGVRREARGVRRGLGRGRGG